MAASHPDIFNLLRETFTKYFVFTSSSNQVLHFLNYRIIQSEHGTSVDQYVHIRQTILHPFFDSQTSVPFQSSPFPLDPAFEMELYTSTPLNEQDLEKLTEQYNGSYNHWTGVLLHYASKTRSDLSYLAMRLAGYNNCASKASYKALYQGMYYLYHHPLIPIMFPSSNIDDQVPLRSHFSKGDAEITNYDYKSHSGLEAWSDADPSRDILSRRSTTSSEHTYNNVTFAWSCTKQPEPGASANDAETRALFYTTRKTNCYRNILVSLNHTQPGPTPTFDDNKATIAQVLKDRLTPRVRHIDVLVAWLNDQFSRERITPVYTHTQDNLADKNSKPHGGQKLQQKHLPSVGYPFYPPPDSAHYRLLQLHEFEIGIHRGSFLKDGVLPPL